MTRASDDSAARPVDPDLTVVVSGVGATGAPTAPSAVPQSTATAAPPPVQQVSSNVLPVGTQLAEFTVTSVVGEGGFGIVYRAHDRSLQRTVAVKEYMPSALASRLADTRVVVKSEQHRETFEIGLKSFINEARLLAQFDHPALVKVFRFWAANGTAYMAMPLYEGGTLKQMLKALAAPPSEAWLRKLLVPLLDAIELLHAADCLHRDIAPDNVMMGPGSTLETPRPVLLDFGAARRVIGGQTQALTVILKPGYAPIEQYDEIPGMKQGPWTDLYALGAVIHTAITGKPPPPSVGRLINDSWVPLSQVAAGRYSAGFLAAIDAVLASRPDDRPRSVAQWREMLIASDGVGAPATVGGDVAAGPIADVDRTEPRSAARTQSATLAATLAATGQRTAPHTAEPRSAAPTVGIAASSAVTTAAAPPTRWGRAVFFGAVAGLMIIGLVWSAIYWQGVKSDQKLARAGSSSTTSSTASGTSGPPVPAPAPSAHADVAPKAPVPGVAPGTGLGAPLDVKPVPTPAVPPTATPPITPPTAATEGPSKTVSKKAEPPRKRTEPARPTATPAAPVPTPEPVVPLVVASAPAWIDTALREGRACLAGKQYACTIARAESVLKAEPNHAGALALLKEGRNAQEQALGSDWKMR